MYTGPLGAYGQRDGGAQLHCARSAGARRRRVAAEGRGRRAGGPVAAVHAPELVHGGEWDDLRRRAPEVGRTLSGEMVNVLASGQEVLDDVRRWLK